MAMSVEDTGNHAQAESGQIERLMQSRELRDCESLKLLLQFLAENSLSAPRGPAPSEQQIALEVFGRRDFDPRTDATVRVQMRRLRAKLAAHYADEGRHDEIIVELPQRSYGLNFLYRNSAPGPSSDRRLRISRNPSFWVAVGMTCVAIALALSRPHPNQYSQPEALRTLWRGFCDATDSPLLVFSNARFTGEPDVAGLRYFHAGEDSPDKLNDHYTGVGEVMATSEVGRLLFACGQNVRVRRAAVMSWDEARSSNVIYLGSPAENLALRERPERASFMFANGGIVNSEPAKGELPLYINSGSQVWALITLRRGLRSDRNELILAGINTLGTQAAADFVCDETRARDLLGKLGVRDGDRVQDFQAVISVQVSGGVPTGTTLAALRVKGSSARPANAK